MFIERRKIHDLKTERVDIAPPLPAYLRVVPIGFCLGLVASIGIAGLSILQLRQAAAELASWNQAAAGTQAELNKAKAERLALEGRAKRASDFATWVEGSRNLEPLVATICTSMGKHAEITDLALVREDKVPFQIKLSIALQTEDANQLDATLEQIGRMNFRPYSAQQRQSKNQIEYEATLIWQGSGIAEAKPPEVAPK